MTTILTLPSVNELNWLREHSHGIVWKRPDGIRARCNGPKDENGFGCEHCTFERRIVGLLVELGKIDSDELTDLSGLTTYAEIEGLGDG